ncbi:MAG: exodeoxyribonuclease V subunit beta, partial [Gammaproteobacteria bacterium]
LWNQALEDWWRIHAYPLSPDRLSLFFRALNSFENFSELQKPLRVIRPPVLLPEVDASLDELYREWDAQKPNLQKLAEAWKQRSQDIFRILRDSKALSRGQKSAYSESKLDEMLARIHDWFTKEEPELDLEIIEYLSLASLEENSKPSQRRKDPELRDPIFVACQNLRDRIDDLVFRFKIRALLEASCFARDEIEKAKRKRRIMTYDDQLTRLHRALEDFQGPELAKNLRQSFPVAMIDEFQDTDAVQYAIFRAIYPAESESTLILIGDPKQSIYRFRGSDIFTYMRARKDAGNRGYTLDTNWRSTPELIQAVNAIFDFRKAPFIYEDAISFSPVQPAPTRKPEKEPPGSPVDSPFEAPLTIWKIPLDESGKPLNTGSAQEILTRATATGIAELLKDPKQRGIRAADIAVLVRTNREGQEIQAALREIGIPSVSISKDNIVHSEEAQGLVTLLLAIAEPGNRQFLRNALSSTLLDLTYPEMDRIWNDELEWQDWSESIRHLSEIWQAKGFMAMFHHLLDAHGIGERIAHRVNAERRLTNLMHLAEWLQEASKQHPAPSSLLAWFARQRAQPGIQETELRLESDEELVKIATIHSSKGLEYPIVFLPFLWNTRPIRDERSNLIEYHDATGNAWLDAGTQPDCRIAAHCLAEKERLAEDLRLLYVALTRARSKIYCAWGRVNRKNQDLSGLSALHYLLHSKQSSEQLDGTLPEGFSAGGNPIADLERLVERSGGNIEIVELPEPSEPSKAQTPEAHLASIELSEFKGHIATDWRIASFTGLTRDIHQLPHHGSPRSEEDPILNFPAGSRTGSFLHLILENLDFQGPVDLQAQDLWQRFAPRFNFESSTDRKVVTQWLENIVNTRINTAGFALNNLTMKQRLNELEFDFSLRQARISDLNRLLNENAQRPLEPINHEDFQGIMNGVIDLVFARDGRYSIADYKTNYLGGSLDDYLPEKLESAIFDRRYDLQYLLYTLALHRYLKLRIPNYRYTEHFGGIYYLFLRGMRPDDTQYRGIYQARPEPAIIEHLDEIVFARTSEPAFYA